MIANEGDACGRNWINLHCCLSSEVVLSNVINDCGI